MNTINVPKGYSIQPPSPVARHLIQQHNDGRFTIRLEYECGAVLENIIHANGSVEVRTNRSVRFDQTMQTVCLLPPATA